MRGTRVDSVTVESCVVRAGAADAGGHEHRAGQHRGRLERVSSSAAGQVLRAVVLRRLPASASSVICAQHEAAVAALVVEVVRVPFAEEVVGPLVGGMAEVVAARIEGQLVEQVGIEVGVVQEGRVGRLAAAPAPWRSARW